MEKPFDVVIKTRIRDAVPFAQLQNDLAAHSRLHGRVYVVVPRTERDQFAAFIGKNYIVMTAEEVAWTAGYAGEFPDTWSTQQIIKLIAANVVENDYFLTLDSNTLIGFDFVEIHFISHGHYVYAVNMGLAAAPMTIPLTSTMQLDPLWRYWTMVHVPRARREKRKRPRPIGGPTGAYQAILGGRGYGCLAARTLCSAAADFHYRKVYLAIPSPIHEA